VREEVDDDVRAGERAPHRRLVEHVGVDGARAEALQPLPATRGPRDAGDPVAGRQQVANRTPPDDPGGSSDHDVVVLHDRVTRQPAES
jgi:hypothetical protein